MSPSYTGDIYYKDATVTGVALGKTSTGKVQLAVSFSTDADPVTAYMFFTDEALPYTEEKLRTLGWDPVTNAWAVDDLIESQSIVGNHVDLVAEMEEYNGKDRLKVKFINACGSGGAVKDKLSDDDAKSFTASLRQRLGVTGGAKRKAKPPVAAAKPAAADDDTPF